MSEYGAVVCDEEHGIMCHPKRGVAIALAMEPLLEDVDCGNREPGRYSMVIYTDPEWCEKQQRYCDEHEHEQGERWLIGQASTETIEVDVFLVEPDNIDGGLDYTEVLDA